MSTTPQADLSTLPAVVEAERRVRALPVASMTLPERRAHLATLKPCARQLQEQVAANQFDSFAAQRQARALLAVVRRCIAELEGGPS